MNTEDKYTKADMIDFGKLCSSNPQMNEEYLYGQWIIPKDVILNLNKAPVSGQVCTCTTAKEIGYPKCLMCGKDLVQTLL